MVEPAAKEKMGREEPVFTAKPPPEVSFKGMVAVGEGGEGVILSSQIDPQLMTDV